MEFDAVIIGSGPNGLAAAIELARAGRKTIVFERAATVGGSARSAELTLPGFTHDICSTVAAMATSSPFFRSMPLAEYGCELLHFAAPFAQPLDDGTAAVLERSVDATAETLGEDAAAWRELVKPFVDAWPQLVPTLLAPPIAAPKISMSAIRFGLNALQSARTLVDRRFESPAARALFAGAAAHSIIPLTWRGTAAFGLVLTCNAHADGWPVVRGGMQKLSDAMAKYFESIGGTIVTGHPVNSLDELPTAKITFCDVTPHQFRGLAQQPTAYAGFRYGPGAFKIDWALSEPIPWKAGGCKRAGTVHLGGTFEELQASEAAAWRGEHADRPYVLVVQPTIVDPSRAPAGKHTAWAYCHVPSGSTLDRTDVIERQVERFAPGFRDTILARHTMNTAQLEQHNPNLVGGDITGGAQTLKQTLFRPTPSLHPYRTPIPRVYLCSSSTPPGGGVHGMCGYHAAHAAMNEWPT